MSKSVCRPKIQVLHPGNTCKKIFWIILPLSKSSFGCAPARYYYPLKIKTASTLLPEISRRALFHNRLLAAKRLEKTIWIPYNVPGVPVRLRSPGGPVRRFGPADRREVLRLSACERANARARGNYSLLLFTRRRRRHRSRSDGGRKQCANYCRPEKTAVPATTTAAAARIASITNRLRISIIRRSADNDEGDIAPTGRPVRQSDRS